MKEKEGQDGSAKGEVDCDAWNESQISATYCIFSVQYKSGPSSLSAVERRDFLGRVERTVAWETFLFCFSQGKL